MKQTSIMEKAHQKNKKKIQIEFVSANPTGPLHVGHGRGAAYGDAIGRILEACGHDVEKEYYVNDAGRQIDILMKLDLAQAQPMGSLIVEGTHRPFHALACALRPATVRIGRKVTER
jgi:arginyl-tRNA synthetase